MTTSPRGEPIAILRSGLLARELCRQGASAAVEAIFERSLYLRAGDTFICIGAAEIGNGPLTLIGDFDAVARLSELGLRQGRAASVSGQRIVLADAVAFTLDRCDLWLPPEWPAAPSPEELADTCTALGHRAAVEAPAEGLAPLVFGTRLTAAPPTPLQRVAGARIARFEAWLSSARARGRVAASAFPEGLVGLGPGLTPSGDDFILGALALLDALAERKAHAASADAVARLSPALTSPLSLCFLRAAANGHVGEPLNRIVGSVISGHVEAAIATAKRIGHCSGWDMLAGVATALRIVTALSRQDAWLNRAPRSLHPSW
jgi:hypothetical protein